MSCSSVEPAAQRACTSANTNTWVNALHDNIQAATVLLELSSGITILWNHCHHYSVHCCSKHHCVAHPCLLRIGSLSDNLVSETQQAAGKESCSLSKFPYWEHILWLQAAPPWPTSDWELASLSECTLRGYTHLGTPPMGHQPSKQHCHLPETVFCLLLPKFKHASLERSLVSTKLNISILTQS